MCRKQLRPHEFNDSRWSAFAEIVDYVQVDATAATDFRRLCQKLEDRDDGVRVFFLTPCAT